jgi:hypothetical protein
VASILIKATQAKKVSLLDACSSRHSMVPRLHTAEPLRALGSCCITWPFVPCGHWILLDSHVKRGILHVIYYDGQEHATDDYMWDFVHRLATLLAIQTKCVLVQRYIISKAAKLVAQLPCFTLEWHCSFGMGTNIQTNLPGTSSSSSCSLCRAPSRRKDVKAFRMTKTSFGLFGTFSRIMEFQTVEQKSEQRWLWKIGATKFREAIQARNPWPILKALGSQPKINYLFAKPDELEQQIRRRAQAKFAFRPFMNQQMSLCYWKAPLLTWET